MSKKDEILQAATKLLALKGFKDTSMAELAKITGVAQGTIFYHYTSKEELFLSILKAFKDDIVTEFNRYTQGHHFPSGLEMMDSVIDFYLHIAGEMEDRFKLLHRPHAYELARVNPDCRDCLESIYDCLIDIFEQAIVTGQQDGTIRLAEARHLAMVIFTMVDGLVRFNAYQLYDAGSLYEEMVQSCRILIRR